MGGPGELADHVLIADICRNVLSLELGPVQILQRIHRFASVPLNGSDYLTKTEGTMIKVGQE